MGFGLETRHVAESVVMLIARKDLQICLACVASAIMIWLTIPDRPKQ